MYSVKKVVQAIYNKVVSHLDQYPLHDKIYKVGSYIFIGYFLCMFVVMLFLQSFIDPQSIVGVFAYLIMGVFTIAVVIEYFSLLKRLYAQKWFKFILFALGAFAYKLAEIHTDHIINNFTGIDPSFLPAASSTLITISLLYIWLLFIAGVMGVYIIFFGFIFTGKNKTKDKDLPIWKGIGRSIGLLIVFVLLSSTLTRLGAKESIMETLSHNIVLTTEYFRKSHCKHDDSSELYAELSRGWVSVYNFDTKKFSKKKCK